jgi:hypothetical protein
MANSDPLVEIPLQPKPVVPETALENVSPANLGSDLQDLEIQDRLADLRHKAHNLYVEGIMLGQRKLYAALLFGLSLILLG